MKTISLKLPDDVHAKLANLSKQRGQAKSDIVRDALDVYLAERKQDTRVSCADLAGDLVGSVSGPTDLATNPKHMQGYGR